MRIQTHIAKARYRDFRPHYRPILRFRDRALGDNASAAPTPKRIRGALQISRPCIEVDFSPFWPNLPANQCPCKRRRTFSQILATTMTRFSATLARLQVRFFACIWFALNAYSSGSPLVSVRSRLLVACVGFAVKASNPKRSSLSRWASIAQLTF